MSILCGKVLMGRREYLFGGERFILGQKDTIGREKIHLGRMDILGRRKTLFVGHKDISGSGMTFL